MTAVPNIPVPANEPVREYGPGSADRAALQQALAEVNAVTEEIPLVIGGRHVHTGTLAEVVAPHARARVLAKVHQGGAAEARAAADAAVAAQREWASWGFEARAAVFLRAADLLASRWRMRVNAATMAGQSKTAHQAEIDAACELVDFLRFNVHYAERLYAEQPGSAPFVWNRLDHRPLEGFVYAVTPFNFTAIAGNLPTAPAILGNVAVWKPSPMACLSNWHVFRLLEEAGLPPGVINFVPGDAVAITGALLDDPRLAGIHFTGSTAVFRHLWREVGSRIDRYRAYPRLVGETGGKDFVLVHESADPEAVAANLIRGAYEYQGQKCSAASRAYVPDTMWPALRDRLAGLVGELRVGDVGDFRNFMGAVINQASFDRLAAAQREAKADPSLTILAGGGADDREGFFVQPTLIESRDPSHRFLCDEFFGPILTVHPYPAARWEETLRLVDGTSPYALTGAIFARDRAALVQASAALRHAAGNLYLNDKPTGAIVGQQPFGGGRASGTNDKAGSILNLLRWASPRTIKEALVPAVDYRYPFLAE